MSSSDEADRPVAPAAHSVLGEDSDRREAMRRIAKYGAYTAPALLAMWTNAKAFQGS